MTVTLHLHWPMCWDVSHIHKLRHCPDHATNAVLSRGLYLHHTKSFRWISLNRALYSNKSTPTCWAHISRLKGRFSTDSFTYHRLYGGGKAAFETTLTILPGLWGLSATWIVQCAHCMLSMRLLRFWCSIAKRMRALTYQSFPQIYDRNSHFNISWRVAPKMLRRFSKQKSCFREQTRSIVAARWSQNPTSAMSTTTTTLSVWQCRYYHATAIPRI